MAWLSLAMTAAAALALPVAYGAVGPLAPAGGLPATLATGGRLTAHYLRGLIVPTGLSIEYPDLVCATECADFGDARTLLGLIVLAGVVAAACIGVAHRLRSGRARTPVGYGADTLGLLAAWLALTVTPLVLVVGMHEPGADRHAYPLLAVGCITTATLVERLATYARRPASVASVVAVVLLALVARGQAAIWRNEETLWSAAVRTAPCSARVHHNLAGVLIGQERFASARRHLKTALRIQPTYAPAHVGLALVACRQGKRGAMSARLASARALGAEPESIDAVERVCAAGGSSDPGPEVSR
jgi:hypothetical protein